MSTDVREPKSGPREPGARQWRTRLAAALPGLILVAVFGFFVVDMPGEARSVVTSGRAIVVTLAIVAGWVVLSLLLKRVLPGVWPRAAVLAGVALVLGFFIVRPYYVDERVEEDESDVFAGQEVERGTTEPTEPAGSVPDPTATSRPAAPVQVTTGAIQGIDHRATGTANVIRRPDGSVVVELADIDIQNGPDLVLYVVPGEDARGTGGGTDLGDLKGNQGTQYYDVPGGVDVGPGWTVLVWCRAFGTPFANATQAVL